MSVGVEGVRRPLHSVEGEVDAFRLADCNQLGIQFLRAVPTAELLDAVFPAVDAFFRHLRIELEGEPTHSNFVGSFKRGNGLFQPPFADKAPWTDHVRNYINRE